MTNTETPTRQLKTGQLVATSATSTVYATVLAPDALDRLTGTSELSDAGWRLAELPNTGWSVLVRLDGETRWLASWETMVATVETRDVATVGGWLPDGTPAVLAALGDRQGGRRRFVRLDGTTTV